METICHQQSSTLYIKTDQIKNHNTIKILQNAKKLFIAKFQSSLIQRKSQQIIADVKLNFQLLSNLNRNLTDNLTDIGLGFFSASLIKILDFNNYITNFLCKTLKNVSQTYQVAFRNKMQNRNLYINTCEICLKKIEQVRLKSIEHSISQNSNNHKNLCLTKQEIKQIYESEELTQFELRQSKNLIENILSEFFLKKDMLLSLNNQKTIHILQQFLKGLSVQGDRRNSIPNIIEKSFIIDYKNGKQIVNKLFNDFSKHIIDVSKTDILAIIQKAISNQQKRLSYLKSINRKNIQTQTNADQKNIQHQLNQLISQIDKKSKFIQNLNNQNNEHKKQIQRLHKQKKRIEKKIIKMQKKSMDSFSSQVQIKHSKSKFQTQNEKTKQIVSLSKHSQNQQKIKQYQKKIQDLQKQILSSYKQKIHFGVQIHFTGVEKSTQTYYKIVTQIQEIPQSQLQIKKNIQGMNDKQQPYNNSDQMKKTVQKLGIRREKNKKLKYERTSISNGLTQNFSTVNLNKKSNKNMSSNRLSQVRSKKNIGKYMKNNNIKQKEVNFMQQGEQNNEIGIQTQQSKIVYLQQLHLQNYNNERAELNAIRNNIKKEIQRKQKDLSLQRKQIRLDTQRTQNYELKNIEQKKVQQQQGIKQEQIEQVDKLRGQNTQLKRLIEYFFDHEELFQDDQLFQTIKKDMDEKLKNKSNKAKQLKFQLNHKNKQNQQFFIKKKYHKKIHIKTSLDQNNNIQFNKDILNQTYIKSQNKKNKLHSKIHLKDTQTLFQNSLRNKQIQISAQQNSFPFQNYHYDAQDLQLFGGLSQSYRFETKYKKNNLKRNKQNKLWLSEKEDLIQGLYNHIQKLKLQNRQFYNKTKAFLKFPYQTAINKFNILDINQSLGYLIFKDIFNFILQTHKNCSQKQLCPHITKFIRKLGLPSETEYLLKYTQSTFPKLS